MHGERTRSRGTQEGIRRANRLVTRVRFRLTSEGADQHTRGRGAPRVASGENENEKAPATILPVPHMQGLVRVGRIVPSEGDSL
jgi:hypothetical protein